MPPLGPREAAGTAGPGRHHGLGQDIDRTIARLRARGEVHEPPAARKDLRTRACAAAHPRRPGDLIVDRSGLLQLDSQEIRFAGEAILTFAAVDSFTRKRVLGAASRITSTAGAHFLARVQERLPFPVRAVQCDGGHELRGAFALAATAAGIAQYTNRPNYPQGNGRVERSFLTDDQEFHEVEGRRSVPTARSCRPTELLPVGSHCARRPPPRCPNLTHAMNRVR